MASVKNSALVRDAEPAIYYSVRQFPFRGMHIVVRGQGEPAAMLGAVRTALGAQPRDVLWLVVPQGTWLALMGGAAGAAGALAIGRALSSLLYGVSAGDATAFSVAIGLAVLTAIRRVPAPRAPRRVTRSAAGTPRGLNREPGTKIPRFLDS